MEVRLPFIFSLKGHELQILEIWTTLSPTASIGRREDRIYHRGVKKSIFSTTGTFSSSFFLVLRHSSTVLVLFFLMSPKFLLCPTWGNSSRTSPAWQRVEFHTETRWRKWWSAIQALPLLSSAILTSPRLLLVLVPLVSPTTLTCSLGFYYLAFADHRTQDLVTRTSGRGHTFTQQETYFSTRTHTHILA